MENFLNQLKKINHTREGCLLLREEFIKRGYQENSADVLKFKNEVEMECPGINDWVSHWDKTGRSIRDIIMDEFRIPGR